MGVAFYAAIEDRDDSDAYAVALSGAAYYDLPTEIPTSIGLEVSYAPDISTFDDGEELLDAAASLGIDISPWADGFVSYRFLEVDYTDDHDHEFVSQVLVGVRLAW